LRICLRQAGRVLTVKGWGFAPRLAELEARAHVDAAITLEPDSAAARRDSPGWSATLRDVRPAQAMA